MLVLLTEKFKYLFFVISANMITKRQIIEFSTYRDTYSKIIDKETYDIIKKKVEHDLEKYTIKK